MLASLTVATIASLWISAVVGFMYTVITE